MELQRRVEQRQEGRGREGVGEYYELERRLSSLIILSLSTQNLIALAYRN